MVTQMAGTKTPYAYQMIAFNEVFGNFQFS